MRAHVEKVDVLGWNKSKVPYVILPHWSGRIWWGIRLGFRVCFISRFFSGRYGFQDGLHGRGFIRRFMVYLQLSGWGFILLVVLVSGINYQWHHAILVVQFYVLCAGWHGMVRPMVPLLPLMRCSYCWAGVNPVQFLKTSWTCCQTWWGPPEPGWWTFP